MVKSILKNDKYRRARGGHSRLLDVSCSKCHTHLFYYQKDGPGILKRSYLDRIVGGRIDSETNFKCPNCERLLGIHIIYKKENRPAIRFFEGAVSKKIIKISTLK